MTEIKLQFTQDQSNALEKIEAFMASDTPVMILGGYAGTGKTTLLKRIAQQLKNTDKTVSLFAPTGRATKILREKTGLDAKTIHSGIYNFTELKEVKMANEDGSDSFVYFFDLRDNANISHQVFIVDESSMVSDDFSEGEFFRFGSGKLFSDLIQYTRIQHPNSGNKLILVGDPAQLSPPTKSGNSPALSSTYIVEKFGLRADAVTLSQVVRQEANSGILATAEQFRRGISSGFFNEFKVAPNQQDIHVVTADNFFQEYDAAPGKKIVITYTNQTALQVNIDIRRHNHGGEYPVRAGDIMMVGQNNHMTGLFNGEFGVINRCSEEMVTRERVFKTAGGKTERVLLKWRKIELMYQDEYGFKAAKETYMLENFLYNQANTLKPEEQQALYVDFKMQNPNLKPGTQMFKDALRSDPFFNALRLKYGFAVTCHKAQGGEWDSAFVFWDFGRPATFNAWNDKQEKTGRNNADFFRWAYTAITRASNQLYCVNPPAFTLYEHLAFVSPATMAGMKHLNGTPAQVDTFEVDSPMLDRMNQYGLTNQPETLRQHFLSVAHQCALSGIEIKDWKLVGYEFNYSFQQGNATAAVKGWIKGNGAINPTYQKNPGGTNSDDLFTKTQKICQDHAKFHGKIPEPESNTKQEISLDWSIAEQKPFLYRLYLDIQPGLRTHDIGVSQLEHQDYKDRYTFERKGEKAIVNIEYDGKGFFGRVVTLPNPAPGASLLSDLESIFLTLKNK